MTNQFSAETLSPILHNEIPVVTTELLAKLYGTSTDRIRQGQARNRERFLEGKHYFVAKGEILENLKVSLRPFQELAPNVRKIILWTERGAARHAKILETDQAWEVFEQLEDCYFSQRQKPESTTTDDRTPLRDAVNMLVGKRGMAYDDAYKLIHHRFGVQHIDQLTQSQMLEAIEYIHSLVIDGPARGTAPLNGRLLLTFRNGEVVGSSMLPDDAHVATMAAFMDLARKAHYVVIHEDDAQPIIQLLTGKQAPARLPAKI
ncbi:antirepressor protein Ant [Klebsiella pneumoniae]|uniref:ORF6N domain-containing protein n=1 Tax=Klebsiella pneumoniae complex TaxID=3390273 RepID=UPI000E2DF298|nr:ORF6N domain-containing protein [Klebsiella pneumoniae]SXY76016.1 antirepressor protein Ant [Klebsiella pneumoniae]VUM42044.1 antirepressor protein Ant [Klebsiella pneumoniae]HBR2863294.1 ORF6N domain-containing protein [Klebsiella pneumoniae]HBR4075887.1 ORF6N domain-containing protein [Klebsiella pneumoniae]HBR4928150.1 ORF6N domain-containing protein [Klebsiella pneumoniae]